MFRSGISNRDNNTINRAKSRGQKHTLKKRNLRQSLSKHSMSRASAPCSWSALIIILPGLFVCLLGFKILFPCSLVATYYACSPGFMGALSAFKPSCIPPSCSYSCTTSSSASPEASIRGWYQGTHMMPSKSHRVTPSHHFLGTRSYNSKFCWKGGAGKQMWPVLLQDIVAAALSVKLVKGTGRKKPVIPVLPVTWWQKQLILNANKNVMKWVRVSCP